MISGNDRDDGDDCVDDDAYTISLSTFKDYYLFILLKN